MTQNIFHTAFSFWHDLRKNLPNHTKCPYNKKAGHRSKDLAVSLASTITTMFLIMNSIGHIIGYFELVSTLKKNRRQKIIIREMLFALLIMLFFYFVGDYLLSALHINSQTIFLAGGIILFLIAIRMIFPESKTPVPDGPKEEPFIFPIATPMVAGPSILTTIMLYSHQQTTGHQVVFAILIAWSFSIIILLFAEEIRSIVGRRALVAAERLMGLFLTMMAVEMMLNGAKSIAQNGIL